MTSFFYSGYLRLRCLICCYARWSDICGASSIRGVAWSVLELHACSRHQAALNHFSSSSSWGTSSSLTGSSEPCVDSTRAPPKKAPKIDSLCQGLMNQFTCTLSQQLLLFVHGSVLFSVWHGGKLKMPNTPTLRVDTEKHEICVLDLSL